LSYNKIKSIEGGVFEGLGSMTSLFVAICFDTQLLAVDVFALTESLITIGSPPLSLAALQGSKNLRNCLLPSLGNYTWCFMQFISQGLEF
jgi:hypothetical protein